MSIQRTNVEPVVTSDRFENLIFWLVGLNAATMALASFNAPFSISENVWGGSFWIIEKGFLTIFTIELCLKLYGLGLKNGALTTGTYSMLSWCSSA